MRRQRDGTAFFNIENQSKKNTASIRTMFDTATTSAGLEVVST